MKAWVFSVFPSQNALPVLVCTICMLLYYYICIRIVLFFPVIAVKTCGSNLQGPSGTFTSPNFPIQYESNSQCVWIITASDPNKVILMSGEITTVAVGLQGRGDKLFHVKSENAFFSYFQSIQ